MSKKSLFLAILLVALGLAGVFSVAPKQARADIAISNELGGQSDSHSGGTGSEVNVTTLGGNTVISDEVNNQTANPGNNSDEGNFTTSSDDGGGGGGGGGSSGGGRRKVAPPQVLGASVCVFPYLTKYIKFGRANDSTEVVKLQRFLRDFQGFSGVAITGVYDEPTLTAVMAFQRRYAKDILEPWGLTAVQPTGYVFITTTLVINRLYCGYSTSHNLDLRNVYSTSHNPAPAHVDKEGGSGKEIIFTQPVIATTTASITVEDVTKGQTAAAGFLDFLKDNLWFWLIPLLILILILVIYYLWWDRTPEERRDYDDEEDLSAGHQDEVIIEEDEGDVGEVEEKKKK